MGGITAPWYLVRSSPQWAHIVSKSGRSCSCPSSSPFRFALSAILYRSCSVLPYCSTWIRKTPDGKEKKGSAAKKPPGWIQENALRNDEGDADLSDCRDVDALRLFRA